MDQRWSDFFNLDSGFVVDGQSVSSSHAMFIINFGTGNSWHQTGSVSAEAFANAVLSAIGPAAFAPAGVSTIRINVSGLEGMPGRQTIEWQWVQHEGAWTFAPIPTAYSGVAAMAVNPITLNSTFQPQNTATVPLTTSKLKGLIQDRLNYGDCAEYVNRLISQAAKMAPANNPPNQFNDIPDLFDQIVGQPNGGFRFEAARGTTIGTGSGSASGYLTRGDATMTITPVNYYANSPSYIIRSAVENAPFRYGITGLHEVIHHAGRYLWDDDFLTKVARSLEPEDENNWGQDENNWGQAFDSSIRSCVQALSHKKSSCFPSSLRRRAKFFALTHVATAH